MSSNPRPTTATATSTTKAKPTNPTSSTSCSSKGRGGLKRRRLNDDHNFHDSFTLYNDNSGVFIDKATFLSKYDTYQVVHLPKCLLLDKQQYLRDNHNFLEKTSSSPNTFTWKDVSSLFAKLNEKDKSSWTEENCGNPSLFDIQNSHGSTDKEEQKKEHGMKSFLFANEEEMDCTTNNQPTRGYSSFIVQHDKEAMKALLSSLPLIDLPIMNQNKNQNDDDMKNINENDEVIMNMKYGPCLWFFYGRNDAININNKNTNGTKSSCSRTQQQEPIEGRPEHTDCISHHGTWHYQLSGIKEWHLKPTEDLIKRMEKDQYGSSSGSGNISKEELAFWKNENESDDQGNGSSTCSNTGSSSTRKKITIRCEEGDVLLVNTRLWWHSTTIPEQPLDNTMNTAIKRSVPSVSYARDIYLNWDDDDNDESNKSNNNGNSPDTKKLNINHDPMNDIITSKNNEEDMTNLDGLYASNDIEAGTIIFTENDMPDCELHRTKKDANCEVIELEDGEGAVVSCRDIKAGEFFCLLESDEEEEEEEEEIDPEEEV